jgi:cytochrome c551/c552
MGFSKMRNIIISLTAVVELLALTAMAGNKGDMEQGKKVFEQCAVCHNAGTDETKVGPSLKGLFQHKKLKNGKSVSDENVLAVINSYVHDWHIPVGRTPWSAAEAHVGL